MNTIEVRNPVFKDAKLGKHVIYQVTGNDYKGEFQCTRRYKEFNALRKALQKRWPGLLVPSIPEKQMIGNLDKDFISIRMRLLSDFLYKVSQITYLYDCEEFQTFIRVQNDYTKFTDDFKEKSALDLAENYSELFQEFLYLHSSTSEEKKIQHWLEVFTKFLSSLESFCQHLKLTMDNFSSFENEVNNMISGINEITSFYSQTYQFSCSEISLRPSYNNPYSILLDWVRVQILDIRAIIDLISKINSLAKNKNKLKEKIDEEVKVLEQKKSGKKKISQIFSKSTKEERVAKQERYLNELDLELKAIEKVCKIVTEKFLNFELVQLRKQLEDSFRKVRDEFADTAAGEIDEIFIQFMPLKTMFDETLNKDSF